MDTEDTLDPKEALKKHVQELVLATMKRHDWSQSDMARQAGMPRNNISLYARGKSIPSYEHAVKLAKVLRVDPAELTGIAEARTKMEEDDAVDVQSTPNGKYLLTLRKELTAQQLSRVLQLVDELHAEQAGMSSPGDWPGSKAQQDYEQLVQRAKQSVAASLMRALPTIGTDVRLPGGTVIPALRLGQEALDEILLRHSIDAATFASLSQEKRDALVDDLLADEKFTGNPDK